LTFDLIRCRGRFWETRHLFNWLTTKASDLLGGTPVEAAAATN
jgi:hypothetical protein